jgi:hypothetical protein
MNRDSGLVWALVGVGLATFGCSGGRGQSTGSSDRDADVGVAVSDIAGILTDTALADASNSDSVATGETTDVVDGPDNGLGEPWPPKDVVAVFDSLPYSLDVTGTFGIPGRFGETAYCTICEGIKPYAFFLTFHQSKCLTDSPNSCKDVFDEPGDYGALFVAEAVSSVAAWSENWGGVYAYDSDSFDATKENLQVVVTSTNCYASPLGRVLWRADCRQRIDHPAGPVLIEYTIDRVIGCCGDGKPVEVKPGVGSGDAEVKIIYRFPKTCSPKPAEHRNTLESRFARGDDDTDLERHYCYPLSDEFIESKPKNEL